MPPLIVLLSALLAGCAGLPTGRAPAIKVGEQYDSARQRLTAAGWTPVPAECSYGNVCFGDNYPEMATNMSTGTVCPVFTKAPSKLVVCLNVTNDGALVKSLQFWP